MTGKLKQMMLYIAEKSKDDKSFGATKLNKILFIADFFAYADFGKPISGATYVKAMMGPVPDGWREVREELIEAGKARIEKRSYFGHEQDALVALDAPDLADFNKQEVEFLDQSIEACRGLNGSELSDWSHNLRPWLDAMNGEEIPYHTVFVLKDTPVGFEDLEWGKQKIKELQAAGVV